jgi:N-carbamoyl-L-amino-acid hydrolase
MSSASSLDQLNSVSRDGFIALLGALYPEGSWVAETAYNTRPFKSLAALKRAMVCAVRESARSRKLALIHSAEQLAPAFVSAALVELVAAQLASYRERFGFPFVFAVQGPRATGLTSEQIISTIERRLCNHVDFEFAEALRNLHRQAELRLDEMFSIEPSLGNQVWDWAEHLASDSDPDYAERGQLTVTYLTDAHRAVAKRLTDWMKNECGFDEVSTDAVGNVVGIYHGESKAAKRLITGSHYDTVRNAGKYDGRLGILVSMACVKALARAGRRLPFGIEVVAFSEEEGQRYKAVFLGSGALTGDFNPAWLEQTDVDGISMRQAMEHAGLAVADIPKLRRDAANYLGFVEVHIEQGPVLNDLDLPLGVVTSINGSVRFLGEVMGMASHAGTTPMDSRRDAAAAVAELILFAEKRASAVADLVATVGMLSVPNGSINVVPGRCHFSLDIRATTDEVRDACIDDVCKELAAICSRRGVAYRLEEAMRVSAAPSSPAWQSRWERAVAATGLPVFPMPSGAGHDAMKIHAIMPQAMLFVRGENAGISHNPLESTTSHDIELCVEAFQTLLNDLSQDPA